MQPVQRELAVDGGVHLAAEDGQQFLRDQQIDRVVLDQQHPRAGQPGAALR